MEMKRSTIEIRNGIRQPSSAKSAAVIPLRVPYKRLLWDSAKLEFTNSADATKLVRRQHTREGWEQIIG